MLLWVNRDVFSPSVFLRDLFTLFPRVFIHSAFLLFSLCSHILFRNCLFPFYPVVGMCSCILPLFVGRIFFRCFGIKLFCLYCCITSLYLSLLSFASTFCFISLSYIVCFTCDAFSFIPTMFRRFSAVFSFSLVVDFLSAFPVEFPIQVLSFRVCLFGEHRFFHELIWL